MLRSMETRLHALPVVLLESVKPRAGWVSEDRENLLCFLPR